MAIDIKKWNKRVQSEVKDKKIRFELNKTFQGEYKTLTEEQAEEIFRRMTGIKTEATGSGSVSAKDTMDIKKWNKIVQDKVTDKKIRFELDKKFQGEYKKLTEEQAREIFKDITGFYPEDADNKKSTMKAGSISPKAGIWKEQVRKEFTAQRGPQYSRLMNQIDGGEIQSQEDFDKALENEKKDLENQDRKLNDLRNSLKAKVDKEMSKLKDDKDLGLHPKTMKRIEDDLKDEIDNKSKDYDFAKARGEGKSEEQIRKEIEDLYNRKIDNAINNTTNEAKAYKMLNEVIADLRNMGTEEAKLLADELEKILYSMGPVRAYEVAQERVKKLRVSLNKDVKDLKVELRTAQKAAEKDKKQIVSVSEPTFDILKKQNFNNYRESIVYMLDKFYRADEEKLLKDIKGKEKLVKDALDGSNFAVFENKKDYEQFAKNPKKGYLIKVKKLFDEENNPILESTVEDINAIKLINDNLNEIKRLIIEFK